MRSHSSSAFVLPFDVSLSRLGVVRLRARGMMMLYVGFGEHLHSWLIILLFTDQSSMPGNPNGAAD